MTTKTFKRHEIKFMMDSEQFEIIKAELEKRMTVDQFCDGGGSYMVYNIYFDTDDDSIIRHSLSKPYYREKLRMRSYTMPTCGEDMVFLELKRKIGDVVAKRRTIMSYGEAVEFLNNRKQPHTDSYQDRQVLHEISAFLDRYQPQPKLYLSYERIAFFDRDDSEFRVSFDKDILTRRDRVNLLDGDFGFELLEDGGYLMEVKCAGRIPLWLCHMLSEMNIYKTSFSKYGEEYKGYLKRQAVRRAM